MYIVFLYISIISFIYIYVLFLLNIIDIHLICNIENAISVIYKHNTSDIFSTWVHRDPKGIGNLSVTNSISSLSLYLFISFGRESTHMWKSKAGRYFLYPFLYFY